jgi:hypothetical protein
LMSIGLSLLAEDAMMFAAVRLLAASGNGTAIETLREVRASTKDDQLQEVIDELLSQQAEDALADGKVFLRLPVSGLFPTVKRG